MQNAKQTDYLTLRDIVMLIWRAKFVIGSTTVIAAVLAIVFSLRMPNLYYAEASLFPVSSSESSSLMGNLSGIASIAGINLGSEQSDKSGLALEMLKGHRFLTQFIKRHQIEEELIAATGWEHTNNQLVYNTGVFNPETSAWVREVSYPYTQKPSDWELYLKFQSILTVDVERNTGVVKLGIEYYSPYLASDWVAKLVTDINQEMRQRDRTQAEKSIQYLQQELESTNIASMREAFYSLVEEQTKKIMLAEVTPDYVFDVIDPPVPSQLKSGPKRSFIVIAVTGLALFLSTLLSVIVLSARR